MNNLKFERPIIFMDLETTGLNYSVDRIVELSVLKIHPDGKEECKTVRIDPEIPIPASATKIHGITNKDVLDKPKFRQYAISLSAFLENCDIAGFGVKRFDLPFIEAEFNRAGVEFSRQGRRILDALEIYHKTDPRDLAAAYKKYCNKRLDNGHTSIADVRAAVEILDRQLEIHEEIPKDINGLHDFCNPDEAEWIDDEGRFIWQEGQATLNFGRYRGRTIREMVNTDPDYLKWILNSDFPLKIKEIVSKGLSIDYGK